MTIENRRHAIEVKLDGSEDEKACHELVSWALQRAKELGWHRDLEITLRPARYWDGNHKRAVAVNVRNI